MKTKAHSSLDHSSRTSHTNVLQPLKKIPLFCFPKLLNLDRRKQHLVLTDCKRSAICQRKFAAIYATIGGVWTCQRP